MGLEAAGGDHTGRLEHGTGHLKAVPPAAPLRLDPHPIPGRERLEIDEPHAELPAEFGDPLSCRTSAVSGGPLRSPMVMPLAPMDLSLSTSCSRVSLWVDPGNGSAVLKFGLSRTSLPCTGLLPRSSMAFPMPTTLSAVFTRATFVFPVARLPADLSATRSPPARSPRQRPHHPPRLSRMYACPFSTFLGFPVRPVCRPSLNIVYQNPPDASGTRPKKCCYSAIKVRLYAIITKDLTQTGHKDLRFCGLYFSWKRRERGKL